MSATIQNMFWGRLSASSITPKLILNAYWRVQRHDLHRSLYISSNRAVIDSCMQCCCYSYTATNLLTASAVLQCQTRSAGHSKWQNIKEIKESKDLQKSKIFSRISMKMTAALREGSSNPRTNYKLASAIEEGKKNNMPKATIEGVIAKSLKSVENGKELFLEYRGMAGVFLYIQLFTDNVKRVRGLINAIVKKFGFAELKAAGSVQHMFQQRGVIVVPAQMAGGKKVTFSEAEEHAIEAGAEEVEQHDDVMQFMCAPFDLQAVHKALEEFGYCVDESAVEFIPKAPIPLDDAGLTNLANCVSKLEELDEVVKVHANVE